MGKWDSNLASNQPLQTIELPTGRLVIRVDQTIIPLDDLTSFAARQNPKRGFLFASKVLGKHIPASPSTIREIHRRLARCIPDLPGPLLFIGMAETAIALGHGVFDEYLALTGRKDAIFVHSTRYRLNHPIALQFKEEHSHAADHLIYKPLDALSESLFTGARSVVIIDDEASTGKTFYNVLATVQKTLPKIESAVTVAITDWRGLKNAAVDTARMPIPTTPVAILHGSYSFSAKSDLVEVPMPRAVGNGQNKDHLLQANFGRIGLAAGQPASKEKDVWHALGLCLLAKGGAYGRNRVLILGTGEFAYPPFLMAEYLEKMGIDVKFQSTTRSPIIPGLAIEERIVFADNYEDGIDNYLYNARRQDYEHIFICHETPDETMDSRLSEALDARNIRFLE